MAIEVGLVDVEISSAPFADDWIGPVDEQNPSRETATMVTSAKRMQPLRAIHPPPDLHLQIELAIILHILCIQQVCSYITTLK